MVIRAGMTGQVTKDRIIIQNMNSTIRYIDRDTATAEFITDKLPQFLILSFVLQK